MADQRGKARRLALWIIEGVAFLLVAMGMMQSPDPWRDRDQPTLD